MLHTKTRISRSFTCIYQVFSSKYWTYPEFNSSSGSGNQNIDFYKQQNCSLDAISSAAEEEDSCLQIRGQDENQTENDRELIRSLIKNFPDPFNYVVGFHCTSNSGSESKRGTNSSSVVVSQNSARKYKQESPSAERNFHSKSISSGRAGATDKRARTSDNNYLVLQQQNKSISIGRNSIISQSS